MHIYFATSKLQALCESNHKMVTQLGGVCAQKLRARLADLIAAETVAQLSIGRPHRLTGDRLGQIAVNLHDGKRLVFEAADEPVPKTQDGAVDWNVVSSIRIVFLGDYHD